jgi:hypothetical protein
MPHCHELIEQWGFFMQAHTMSLSYSTPFRFVPNPALGTRLQSRAFALPFKAFASSMFAVVALWMLQLVTSGQLDKSSTTLAWFAAALAMMAYTLWHMWRSVTTLDAQRIEKTWVWHKSFDLRDLAYAKLIRVPGLDWLIAPRLYLRTVMGKFAVFYAADPVMIAEFARLAKALEAYRRSNLG